MATSTENASPIGIANVSNDTFVHQSQNVRAIANPTHFSSSPTSGMSTQFTLSNEMKMVRILID
jgi:hypothetical protein